MAEYEDLRQRHLADLAALLPEHVQRLRWPAERLRQERLRERSQGLIHRLSRRGLGQLRRRYPPKRHFDGS